MLRDFEAGRKAALARVISMVENEARELSTVLAALYPHVGRAHRIGITGPPGAGKSTLLSELIRHFRGNGETVGIIAVDPTSPYTGGALLGDRIRMNELALDDGVFIRSMATRGSLGGLALSTKEVADVMDAFGFDRVLIETVGVGQSELAVASAVDTTVVILVPESGDSVQAMKTGLMEASDIFVINKADRPGAERMAREVTLMLQLRLGKALRHVPAHHGVDLGKLGAKRGVDAPVPASSRRGEGFSRPVPRNADPQTPAEGQGGAREDWKIPVLQTVAETGEGVDALVEALDRHSAWLEASGERGRQRETRLAEHVRETVERALRRRVWVDGIGSDLLAHHLQDVVAGAVTPYDLAARILHEAGLAGGSTGGS